MQWKLIYLAQRNPTLTAAQFPQAWREHSAKGKQCRNVQDKIHDVSQCTRALSVRAKGLDTGHDGVGVMCLRDLAAATEIWSDAETLAIMRPDEPRVFSTYTRNFTLIAQEHCVRDVPRGAAALFGFLRRRSGTNRAEFEAGWLDGSPRWLAAPALSQVTRRVVHNAVGLVPPPGYDYDGIGEWWFGSLADLKQALAAGVQGLLPGAYAKLLEWETSTFIATRVTHARG
ncbi:MAG TPA: EthD domain-containing protein [Nevskiaceae bacterium]|nr:EthD domain-containing protein [Nevskiaceae bacterium]